MKIDSEELLNFLMYQRNHSRGNTFDYDEPYANEFAERVKESVYESLIEWVEEKER